MTSRRKLVLGVALALTLSADAVGYALLIGHAGRPDARWLLTLASALWVLAVALLAGLRPGRRTTAVVVLGAGAVLGLIALSKPASTSDDYYRYIWDAKVQLHGTDPYRYAPSSPQLANLRDRTLFGAPGHCTYAFPGGCTSINRPTVHTIYPPVAEGAFVLVRAASLGDHGQRLPLQIAGLVGSLLIGWLLVRWAAPRGRPWLAAVWMWCPVVSTEYVNNAHIDWLAVLLVVLAVATPVVRRPGWVGVLVGAAIAVKIYPVLVLPSLLRRHPFATAGAALGLVVLVYLPHVAAVGTAVIGYLPGYLHEENYGNGQRLLLLDTFLPAPVDTVVGVLIVAGVAIWAWRRGDPAEPQRSAVLVMGVALFTFTPSFGWYLGILVLLVAMTGAFEWAPLCIAGSFAYLGEGSDGRNSYLVAAVLALILFGVRVRFGRSSWPVPRLVAASAPRLVPAPVPRAPS